MANATRFAATAQPSRQFRRGVLAHFERRLISERAKDGIIAARARGKHPGRHPLDPDKIAAAIQLVKAGLSPTAAARQLGLGRSTVYREINQAGVERDTRPSQPHVREKFYLPGIWKVLHAVLHSRCLANS